MNPLPDNSPNSLDSDVTRREFMKSSSFAAAMTMLGGIPLLAQQDNKAAAPAAPAGPTIKCAVIGCNVWGREILGILARLPKAEVIAVSTVLSLLIAVLTAPLLNLMGKPRFWSIARSCRSLAVA